MLTMSRWKLQHMFCNPRYGFTAILLFVTVTSLLMIYLYSSSLVTYWKADVIGTPRHPLELAGDRQDVEFIRPPRQDNLENAAASEHETSLKTVDNQHWKSPQTAKRQRKLKMSTKEENELKKMKMKPRHEDAADMKQVSDVISLISQNRSPNATLTMAVQKEALSSQIRLLRDAMLSENTMLPKLDKPPSCVGNLEGDEVEDILCIPRPKYLSYMKNPCWYEKDPLNPQHSVLHCLPYFHVLGTAKSGTTDLWKRLGAHPHIVLNNGFLKKEALWWSWRRYGFSGYKRMHPLSFDDYVRLFQETALQSQSSMDTESLLHHILITGDASPPDFWDFRGWPRISQNRNFTTPRVVTPHLMRHLYANPKFILMFRDPIDRLYSDYFFVGGGLTSQDFHNDILATIDLLARCVKQHGLQRCFYDHELYIKLPVRLPFACYSLFMREWLQVFSLDNFLFIKTEIYKVNPEETLKSVMDFLGLGPLEDEKLEEIADEEKARVTQQRQVAGPMKNATKEILHQLLDPCNEELARMIKQPQFVWNT